MAEYTYTGGKFVPTGGGTTIDPAGGFTSSLVSRDSANKTKIMAVGDSITLGQGSADTGGWRMLLWQKLTDAGFQFTPVGWNTQPPYSPFSNIYVHQGTGYSAYGGWKIEDCSDTNASRNGRAAGNPLGSDGIAAWLTTYNPDLLLVLLGTNNTGQSDSSNIAAMADFTTRLYGAKPNVKVIWGSMPYQSGYKTTYPMTSWWQTEWNKWTAQGKTIVKAETADTLGWSASRFVDQVHPNLYGYERLASAWFNAIVSN